MINGPLRIETTYGIGIFDSISTSYAKAPAIALASAIGAAQLQLVSKPSSLGYYITKSLESAKMSLLGSTKH